MYVESPYASLRPEIDPIPIPRWALNHDKELTAFIRIVFQYSSNHNLSRKLQVRKEVPKLLFCSPTSAQFAREVGGESSQYPIINYTYRSLLLRCYSMRRQDGPHLAELDTGWLCGVFHYVLATNLPVFILPSLLRNPI